MKVVLTYYKKKIFTNLYELAGIKEPMLKFTYSVFYWYKLKHLDFIQVKHKRGRMIYFSSINSDKKMYKTLSKESLYSSFLTVSDSPYPSIH